MQEARWKLLIKVLIKERDNMEVVNKRDQRKKHDQVC